ncbi:hypothetical protein AB7M49_000941 [Bradyrhizobium elkanii]
MEWFCGLDVGMDESAICVVDDKGAVALQTTVVTDPDAIKTALKPYLARLRRLGHEAGALSPWLHPELLKLGLPAVCLETLHVRAALNAQRNKTDKTDALGIAHIMRTGWFRTYQERSLLPAAAAIDPPAQSEAQVFGPRERGPALAEGVRHPPEPGRAGRFCASRAVKLVAGHALCRRFMQIPGVGPIAALSFMTAIDDPSRFRRSRDVAAYFWPDLAALAVGHLDRRAGPHQEGRRRRRAPRAVRGGERAADPLQEERQGQKLGSGARQTRLTPQGDRCSGAQTRRDHACDVGRRHVLLRRS